jgi:hypothetical protein
MSVLPNPAALTNPVAETVATSVEQVHGTVDHCAIEVTSLADPSAIVAMAVSWLVCPIAVRRSLPVILIPGMIVLEGWVVEPHAAVPPHATTRHASAVKNREGVGVDE